MRSFAVAFAAIASLASVSATIYVTEPVASTSCAAGATCTVAWNDDGTAPALATIGVCSIDLCTGGAQQQTCLQNVGTDDVSQTASVTYIPSANIGPSGSEYFIKFTSVNYKDPTNPTFPYTAFSAKFTLTGMTGTFNSTVQAQISGGSTAAATTSAATVATATSAATSIVKVSTAAASSVSASKAATVSSAKSTASATTKTSGAVTMSVPGVVSSIAGLTVFMSFASVFLGMLAFGL